MTNHTPRKSFIDASKDKKFQQQMKRVFLSFYKSPKTMLMVEKETGIMRSNICWYVRKWRKNNCIQVVKEAICPISKHRAQYLSTNPELIVKKKGRKA